MAKRNADFWVLSQGLSIFMKSLNLMDLAFDKKKAKPKALASCADGNEMFPCPRTTLSPGVTNKLK